ncbi:MAG: hypothetical protein U0821_06675 [Chloroflexota bacterium]
MWVTWGKKTTAGLMAAALLLAGWAVPSARADACPEPNDAMDRACDLALGKRTGGELDTDQDADRYRLQVGEGQSVLVTLKAGTGMQKLRLETADGVTVADVGLARGEREVLAERLPAGTYYAYVAGEYAEPGGDRSYSVWWSSPGSGDPVVVRAPGGKVLRDLPFTSADVGDKATQTDGRLVVGDRGRIYQSVFEREDTVAARKAGPQHVVSRVFVGEDEGAARAVFEGWNVFDLPEADEYKHPYEFLGEQSLPKLADEIRGLSACQKCNDGENPRRHFRVVMRSGNAVVLLYTWGRDAGNNSDTVIDLLNRILGKL